MRADLRQALHGPAGPIGAGADDGSVRAGGGGAGSGEKRRGGAAAATGAAAIGEDLLRVLSESVSKAVTEAVRARMDQAVEVGGGGGRERSCY